MVTDLADEMDISKIITDDLPDAVMLPMIQQTTKQDPICNKIITRIQKGYITDDPALKPYRHIFRERDHIHRWRNPMSRQLAHPRCRISSWLRIIQMPSYWHHTRRSPGNNQVQATAWSKVWFRKLTIMIQEKIQQCQGCKATSYHPAWGPFKPTPLPDRPWQQVDMDFCGPLPSGEHMLVAIDEYS